jgi:hypothetical protein
MAPDYLVERGISAVPGKGDEVLIGLSAEQDTSEASQIRFFARRPHHDLYGRSWAMA